MKLFKVEARNTSRPIYVVAEHITEAVALVNLIRLPVTGELDVISLKQVSEDHAIIVTHHDA